MYDGRRWRSIGIGGIAALTLITAVVAPVFADVPHAVTGTPLRHHARASTVPVRCKHRNKAAGTVIWSDWQFPDTLNVFQTQASVTAQVVDSILEGLTIVDAQGRFRPDLLRSIPTTQNGGIRNNGLTFVTSLKRGLRWSNGAEITAADVKFGLAIGLKSGWCSGSCDVITRMDTVGKYGMVFHLKHVYAAFVANALSAIPVFPVSWPGAWTSGNVNQAVDKLFNTSSFNFEDSRYPTNGAFQVANYVQDDRIVLHPMRYYSTLSCGARVKNLIFSFYTSKASMIAAAIRRQTDATSDYTPADLPLLTAHSKQFTTYVDPAYSIEHLTFNVDPTFRGDVNPLHDVRVRQALALTLDKYGVLQSAFGISRSQAAKLIAWTPLVRTKELVQPFADGSLTGQWDPIAKRYISNTGSGQALADAQTLLAQAGYPGGHFTLDAVTTLGNFVRVAQFGVMANSWAKLGVTLDARYIPAGELFGDYQQGSPLQTGDFQIAMYTDTVYPDPDLFKQFFEPQYIDRRQKQHSPNNANASGINDKVITEAFDKAAGTLTASVRNRWYKVWQTRLNQEAYWIPLYYGQNISTQDGKIINYKPNPTNEGEEWNTFQWAVKSKS